MKNILDTYEKTGKIPKWKPVVGAMVEVFEDPITQHKHEGVAKIVKIHSKTSDGILDCDVRFIMEGDCLSIFNGIVLDIH